MDDVADSQAFDFPQSHETFTLALTGQAPMQKSRKWNSSLGFCLVNKNLIFFPLDHLN